MLPTDGAEGLALGIFNRLAPLGKLMEETMGLAKQIVAKCGLSRTKFQSMIDEINYLTYLCHFYVFALPQ